MSWLSRRWIIATDAPRRTNGRAMAAWACSISRSRPWGGCWRPRGIELPPEMPLPVKLEEVQELMAAGDERARLHLPDHRRLLRLRHRHYADFYDVRNLLVLGRVMTGEGGDLILAEAREVLRDGVSGAGRAHPLARSRREGEAARTGHRRRQPARHSKYRRRCMQFHNAERRFFRSRWPAGDEALARTTHLCISRAPGRYRDHGLPRHRRMLRPAGQLVHRRGGDQRRRQPARGHLRRLHRRRRCSRCALLEQRKAAFVGDYACQIQLGFTSAQVKNPARDGAWWTTSSAILRAARPRVRLPAQSGRQARYPRGVALRAIWRAARAAARSTVPEQGLRLRSMARPGLAAGRGQAGAAGLERVPISPPRWWASSIRR